LTSGSPDHPIAQPRLDPRARFQDTAAFRRFGATLDPAPDALEDLYTKAIIAEQGFDGLPQVVPKSELDRYVSAGEVEVFRGLTDAAYAEQLRYGEMFVGRGSLGGGINTAAGPSGLELARVLAEGSRGAIVRMTIKAGARIVDARELARRRERERERLLHRIYAEHANAVRRARGPGRSENIRSLDSLYNEEQLAIQAPFVNFGRYAAFLGYDGIFDPESGCYLVMNRTALRVQQEDEP
jgi:hypothetical protein